jgi:signal peptidase II
MTRDLRLRLGYGLVALAVVVIDQVSKQVVGRLLSLHESRSLVPGLLQLTHVHNRGAAFGFLSNVQFPGQAVLFGLLSLFALALILGYAMRLPAARLRPQVALALVLGGAIGNLIDRVRHGYVDDFIDAFWSTHHWPTFNAADSAISIGVALLILDMLREPRPDVNPLEPADTAPASGRRME